MADDGLSYIMVDMEFGELMKDWIEDWSDDEIQIVEIGQRMGTNGTILM